MRAQIRLQDVHLRSLPDGAEDVAFVIGALERAGLAAPLTEVRPPGGTWVTRGGGWGALAGQVAATPGVWEFASSREAEPDVQVEVTLRPCSLLLLYLVRDAAAEMSALLDRATALVCDLAERVRIGPQAHVEILDAAYPRPRPPRQFALAVPGTAATFVDVAYFEAHPTRGDEELAALLHAPLPLAAERHECGRVTAVLWANTLMAPAPLARARSRQEQWLGKHSTAPVQSSFNEAGDKRVRVLGAAPRGPLTLYDERSRYGFLAVVPPVDDERLADAAGWRDKGALPDGTPLSRLFLIAPRRTAALGLHVEVQAAGLDGACYMDDDGRIWNPSPPGLWIDTEER